MPQPIMRHLPNADFTQVNRRHASRMDSVYARYERMGREAAKENKGLEYAMTLVMGSNDMKIGHRPHVARRYWRQGWRKEMLARSFYNRYGRSNKMRILTLSGAQEVVKTGKVENVNPVFLEEDQFGPIDVDFSRPQVANPL